MFFFMEFVWLCILVADIAVRMPVVIYRQRVRGPAVSARFMTKEPRFILYVASSLAYRG